ncbi:hypothetical protein ACIBVL_04030 [Streptomyces sp. NPDC049687]|uniref:hypothetical protein n=1 Tax=Streptomyces sp. NPDC049687 TaxID=3365596 RepID=UPI0037BA96F6
MTRPLHGVPPVPPAPEGARAANRSGSLTRRQQVLLQRSTFDVTFVPHNRQQRNQERADRAHPTHTTEAR